MCLKKHFVTHTILSGSNKMGKTTFIYTLSHPTTGEVRYVGKSDNPNYRFINHCKDKRPTRNRSWILGLKNQGLLPVMEVLEEVKNSDWEDVEKYWIAQMKAWGFRLNNITSGGNSGYERKVDSNGNKQGGSKKGRVLSLETRAKMSLSRIGNKHRLGIPHSKDVRDKIKDAVRGKPRRPHSEETKRILSERAHAQWASGKGHHPLKRKP